MLFFPYPTIKRLSPVKRKIKFHDGTQNRDIQGENTPKPTLSKPENTKIGESGGKKAGSPRYAKRPDSHFKRKGGQQTGDIQGRSGKAEGRQAEASTFEKMEGEGQAAG